MIFLTLKEALKKFLLRENSQNIKAFTCFRKIDVPVIIDYVSHHTYLSTVLVVSEDGGQLIIKTKESQKHFIKLLSDDYLESPLTKILYDSLAKDELKTN